MKKWTGRHLDDFLLVLGCACVLYGLSMWNVVVTWITAGSMLIAFGVMVGKAQAQNVIE